jgi:hypothetical protein
MGSKELMSKYVLDGTAFQSDQWFFQPKAGFAVPASSLFPHDFMLRPLGPKFDEAMYATQFFVFKLALGSKPSGDSPESRRNAENGSNHDSSEAVCSGSGESERPESPQIANSFSGINATSSFMIQ